MNTPDELNDKICDLEKNAGNNIFIPLLMNANINNRSCDGQTTVYHSFQ